MAFELPATIYSPELLESVIYEINEYLDWYRENKVHQQVGAPAAAEPDHSTETAQTIEAWAEGKSLTLTRIQELVEHLEKLKLPVVHVTLAALPNHTQRQQLVEWFRLNAGTRVLLSFVGDRDIGGGVVIRTPNRVFDYSWKQRLLEGRAKLGEVVRRV
jgi:hypothetical protein